MRGTITTDLAHMRTPAIYSVQTTARVTALPRGMRKHLAHRTGANCLVDRSIRIAHHRHFQTQQRHFPATTSTFSLTNAHRLHNHVPPSSSHLTVMGKSQSKLTPEQLQDLQKNTYCMSTFHRQHSANYLPVDKKELQQWYKLRSSSSIISSPPGTRAFAKTAPQAS